MSNNNKFDSVLEFAIDDVDMNLIETVAGASMDVDLCHFDPSDPEEMALRALDDMIPEDIHERISDDDGEE